MEIKDKTVVIRAVVERTLDFLNLNKEFSKVEFDNLQNS